MIFYDTSYLVRIYLEDPGWEAVRELCATDDVAASEHARAEIPAALHRAFREGRIDRARFDTLLAQYEIDCSQGAYAWQSLSSGVLEGMTGDYRALPPSVFLRAADALHLACARDHGFKIIYSNDKNLLAAARHFGLRGKNVI